MLVSNDKEEYKPILTIPFRPLNDTVVAFAGVHLDLFNRTTDLFVEMLRKVQLHTRDNVFQQNQVAFAASRILASKHIALDDHYAEKDLWNLCSIGAFNESGCCLTISSGKCAPNKLFPKDLIRLASPEDYYALLFIKQKNILVLIRSVPEQRDGYDRQYWTVRYHHVSLTDSDADVANSWKVGLSPAELLDYRVIGAIEQYKRYYLVTVNYEEALQLRKITDYSDFPLKLAEAPIDFHHFFHCRAVDFAQYYQTMVNAVVVVFCCGSYWVCRKAADYQRQLKPMAKGAVGGSGKKTMMMTAAGRRRRLRPTAGSEKQKIASQYLWRAGGTDKYYVDERRLQRDERRVCASIAHMAKLMLHTADMDQLKEKIAKRKAGAKERRMG